MDIKVITDNDEFIKLEHDWNRLAENLITVNKFDWLYKWWQYNKNGNDLRILAASENGKILGIAPIYIENTRALKFIPFKVLKFLGGKISDFLDFLIDEDENREIIFKALFDFAVNELGVDLFQFQQIKSSYPNFDLWQKYIDQNKNELSWTKECLSLKLGDYNSYQDFYSRMNKSLKKTLKLSENRLNKNGVDIQYVFKKDIEEEDINIIADINIKRQEFLADKSEAKRFSYFISPQTRSFIKDYFCSSDSTLLGYMKCNGKVISYTLSFLDKRIISFWSTGFDPDYDMYSPTKLLINEEIKSAFENNYEYFDFMRGNDKYKQQWSNNTDNLYDLTLCVSTKAGIVSLYRICKPDYTLKKIGNFINNLRGKNNKPIVEI